MVDDQAQLKRFMGGASIQVYDQSWSEDLVQFLVSWPVRIVLVIIFLVCLFMEMLFPGTGLFAAGSVVSIAILIGAPALAGLADWWDLLAVVLGIILVAVELLLMPGVLIAGISGAILLMIGLVGTFVSGDMTNEEMQQGIVQWGACHTHRHSRLHPDHLAALEIDRSKQDGQRIHPASPDR